MGDNGNRDPVAISIEDKFRPLPTFSSDCCIYRVPENLRKVNEEAYRPLVVSIGPFYHNDPKLQPMQDHKLRLLQSFLQPNVANNMDRYVRFIRQRQQDVRNCYAEQFELNDDTFVEMVLIDAAFIIELFLLNYRPCDALRNDPIFRNAWMIGTVIRDIRLEENQLPFFILNDLYNLAFPPSLQNGHRPFVYLTYRFLLDQEDALPNQIQTADIKHFVDFLRVYYSPFTFVRERPDQNNDQKDTPFPRVTELSEAGVKFKKSESKHALDIKFTKGVLEIGKLRVEDHTESLFRNIMAFEQCHHLLNTYITDYFSFMDDLIDTTKDVEILIKKGILVDWLGSNEDVRNLFNNISKQIAFDADESYYSGVCRDLKAYVKKRRHRWRAILKSKYFNHPWSAISVIYLIMILILALLQVISGFTKK